MQVSCVAGSMCARQWGRPGSTHAHWRSADSLCSCARRRSMRSAVAVASGDFPLAAQVVTSSTGLAMPPQWSYDPKDPKPQTVVVPLRMTTCKASLCHWSQACLRQVL